MSTFPKGYVFQSAFLPNFYSTEFVGLFVSMTTSISLTNTSK